MLWKGADEDVPPGTIGTVSAVHDDGDVEVRYRSYLLLCLPRPPSLPNSSAGTGGRGGTAWEPVLSVWIRAETPNTCPKPPLTGPFCGAHQVRFPPPAGVALVPGSYWRTYTFAPDRLLRASALWLEQHAGLHAGTSV